MPDTVEELYAMMTPEERKALGRRIGGANTHKLHPEHAVEAGRKGGLASVAANPFMRSSEHGRRLALSRKPRWQLAEGAEIVKKRKAKE